MFGAAQPVNVALIDLLVDTGPDKFRRKNALKALAACEDQLEQLNRTESLILLAHDVSPTQVSPRLIAITDLGVTAITKRKVERRFTFDEIALTRLLRHERGIIVVVETHRAINDFMPNDFRRYEHILQFFTATPGSANSVCASIDRRLG